MLRCERQPDQQSGSEEGQDTPVSDLGEGEDEDEYEDDGWSQADSGDAAQDSVDLKRSEGASRSRCGSCASCVEAIERGHLACFQRAHQEGDKMDSYLIRLAADRGRRDILVAARDLGCPWDPKTAWYPAYHGDVEFLQWLKDQGMPQTPKACQAAAKAGNISSLHWLQANGWPWGHEVMAAAAQYGRLKVLQWALRMGRSDLPSDTCDIAASHGQLEVLRYACVRDCPWTACIAAGAAANGHVDTLRWALKSGCPGSLEVCRQAAARGQLECLICAREFECPWDASVPEAAAREGHVNVLRWIIQNGCEVDASTCIAAAQTGNPAVLQCAMELGCPYDCRVCEQAHTGEVLLWALSHGAPAGQAKTRNALVWLGMLNLKGKLVGRQCFAIARYLAKRKMSGSRVIQVMAVIPMEVVKLICDKLG